MTPQEIKENNILLAEFIGWKRETVVRDSSKRPYDFICPEHIEVIGESDWDYCSDCGRDTYRKNYLFGEDLVFHNDWNWLMEVVKAIGDRTEYELVSGYNYSYWNRYGENPILDKEDIPQEFGGYSDIINIYEACVVFVKWYNQNKGGN